MGAKLEAMQKEIKNLRSQLTRLSADYENFKKIVMEIKPEGFNPEEYLGFSIEQLVSVAKEHGKEHGFKCQYECQRCVKGQRLTCWETLTGEVDDDEEGEPKNADEDEEV